MIANFTVSDSKAATAVYEKAFGATFGVTWGIVGPA